MRTGTTSRRSTLLLYGGATVLAALWMVPFAAALMIAVLPISQTRNGWWNFSPDQLTFANFTEAWREGVSSYALNSLIITGLAVLLTVAVGTLAAYAFARMHFRLKRATFFLLITTMIVPIQIILVPLLPWFRSLGLTGSWTEFVGLALVHTAFGAGWAIFMMGTFFADIPGEIIDAAMVDGARPMTLFRRVALPLAMPGIVSFAIIDFIFVWNDLLLALTLVGRDRQPLTVGLANLSSPHLAQENLVAAGSILAILPPMLLFASLNRYYVRGLFAGATKG
jgi:ABC-type glycerol-3-phosphate transport system permease component